MTHTTHATAADNDRPSAGGVAGGGAVGVAGGYRVGVDIGGTKIEAVAVDVHGAIVADRRIPARRGGDNVVEDVAGLVRDVVAGATGGAAGCGADSTGPGMNGVVASVGIGTPGRVDSATGHVSNIVNLDVDELALGPRVSERLGGVPVTVENDVNAAAVGAANALDDARDGGGEDAQAGSTVVLNFGTGFAAGILIDGVLQHGAGGACGEIGHIPIDPNRFPCPCGQVGCLETVCSGSAVARLWPVPADSGMAPMPDLITRARAGEPEAERVLAMVTHAIGDGLQIVVQTVDPDVIILGGGMAKTGMPLVEVVRDEMRRREATCPFLAGLRIGDRLRLAPTDVPLGAYGAAVMVNGTRHS
ncbi:NagC family transcriptional regulator [Bifidobacterium rousetti]|uniref:ROK family protein n=1 Tax=Bifidobacterium rousetti TaxID=2045439 RepID=UPI00123AFDCE|nr:ROK family protein [Bifidobacterium rousetti]KAA8819153.1 NagC family transcriptional regulator [Bifidobacterium rousetti]